MLAIQYNQEQQIEALTQRVKELEEALQPFAELHNYGDIDPDKVLSVKLFNVHSWEQREFFRFKSPTQPFKCLKGSDILRAQKVMGGLQSFCNHPERRWKQGEPYAYCASCKKQFPIISINE